MLGIIFGSPARLLAACRARACGRARARALSLSLTHTYIDTHIHTRTRTHMHAFFSCSPSLSFVYFLIWILLVALFSRFLLARLASTPAGRPVHACCSPNQRHPVPSSRPPGARGLKVTSFLVPPANRAATTLLHLEPRSVSRSGCYHR